MFVIVCVDDKNGMLFNKRRQSRDKAVLLDIKDMVGENLIYMKEYTGKMFSDIELKNFHILSAPLGKMEEIEEIKEIEEKYVFLEDESISSISERIKKLIVYRWNRIYPADFHFDISLEGWKLIERKEFVGTSHENITKEVYVR